jgi:hypothetical protein
MWILLYNEIFVQKLAYLIPVAVKLPFEFHKALVPIVESCQA